MGWLGFPITCNSCDMKVYCENLRDTAPAWPRRHVNTPLENNFSNIFLSTTRNFPAEFSCLAAAGLGWAGGGWLFMGESHYVVPLWSGEHHH